MTGLACALALQAAMNKGVHRPGVNLVQELHGIRLPKGEPLMLLDRAYSPKTIALTFDDGPHGDKTIQLLEVLRQLQIRATFFVVGKMVDKAPWIVREEVAQGHEIGNHTYDHLNLDTLTWPQIALEYKECSDAVERAAGFRPKFCRPPGGRFDTGVLQAAEDEGMWTVLWTDDPGDFALPDPKVLVDRLDRQLKDGGILLLHDGIPETIKVLPEVVQELRKRGYRFVTCSELLAERNRAEIYARRSPPTIRDKEASAHKISR